jgi:spore coat protein U-like protein
MKIVSFPTILVTAAASIVLASPAMATTASSSFPVNATISTACSLSSTAMNFGEVGTAGATTLQTDSTSTITVTCTTGGAYTVALDGGLNAVAAQRNIKSGANTLAYDLFKDAARGTVWTNVTAPAIGLGTASAQTITVYGRIAAGLPFSASNDTPYSDTVLVTLTY